MSYPVLAPGTLVKPQIRGLTFHWLRVVEDPGPEHLPKRVVTLARTEPERADQWLKVRRDRVHDDASRMSVFDVKPTPATSDPSGVAAPVTVRKPRARGKDSRYTALGEVWDCAQPLPAYCAAAKERFGEFANTTSREASTNQVASSQSPTSGQAQFVYAPETTD
jgi:hypothetical protein